MSRAQREKGAIGEREVQDLARALGFPEARRAFASGGQGGGDLTGIPGVCLEVKRVERLNVPAAFRQAQAAAADTEIPVVAHRSSRQPWLATLPLVEFLVLLKAAQS